MDLPPTFAPTGADDDSNDDGLTVKANIANLEWADIWNLLVPCLIAAAFMVAFAAWQMRKRSSFHHVYCPRYRWERDMASKSPAYTPLARPKRRHSSLLEWVRLVAQIDDAKLLRHVGLEMYVLLRFIRVCWKVAIFGVVVVMPIGISVYATADQRSATSGYSRVAWYRFTLANVDPHHEARLYTPAILMWVVTLQLVMLVRSECFALVELRQSFFTTAPVASDPVVAEQQLRSVMIERLPPQLRTSERLYQHWNALMPGRVHSASVCLDTSRLTAPVEKREAAALELERLLLLKERTGIEPVVGSAPEDKSCCGLCDTPTWCVDRERLQHRGESALEFAKSRLKTLNEDCAKARIELHAEAERSSPGLDVQPEAVPTPAAADHVSAYTRVSRLLSGSGTRADARRIVQQSGLVEAARGTTTAVTSAVDAARRVLTGGARSDTGFVTFRDYTAANMVRHMQLSERPHREEARTMVPDVRDIVWENLTESFDAQRDRQRLGDIVVYVIAFFWSFFIALCYAVANYDTLKQFGILPSLSSLNRSEQRVVRYILTILPIGLISLTLAVFPILLEKIAVVYEHTKLRSLIQLSVLSRNFFLQMINLWLTVVAGSVWDVLKLIIRKPAKVFRFIGAALPTVSVYFVQLIVIRTFISLFWELARVFPWLRLRAARIAAGGALTARDHINALFLKPEFSYGCHYSSFLMVIIIGLLFAVIAPMTYVFVACYFFFAYLVFMHQALHVYIPKCEAGGIFFFTVYTYLLGALIGAQVTLLFFLLVKEAFYPAILLTFLPVVTYIFKLDIQANFAPACERPSLELILTRDNALAKPPSDAEQGLRPPIDALVAQFDPTLYRQPELDENDAAPLPLPPTSRPFAAFDKRHDDLDVDDQGAPEGSSPRSAGLDVPLVPNASLA